MFGELRQDLFSGFGHIQTELQRHLEAKPDPWPPTQNPRPLRWSEAHEDWMGHALKVDDSHAPSHQQQASSTYLCVAGGRALGLRQRDEDFI